MWSPEREGNLQRMPGQDTGEDRKEGRGAPVPRYTRRLTDKILIAFHQACDQRDFEVAEQLLHILETMVARREVHPGQNRRKTMESFVAAHERLWHLRHPED